MFWPLLAVLHTWKSNMTWEHINKQLSHKRVAKPLKRQRLTFQVAGLSVPEADGQVLQALRQRRDHVPQQPLLLLGAVAAARLQGRHSPLAPVKHLERAAILNSNRAASRNVPGAARNARFEFRTETSADGRLLQKRRRNSLTCVISCVVISIACSSSLLSSSVGRFMCLSWSKASSFIFCRTRVISYWIWKWSWKV